jgi:hypothetical protein
VAEFLGDGGAFQVQFVANDPPEQQATVTITVRVGLAAASSVPVRCEVTIDPHFTLDVVGGGAPEVARGASITLTSSDNTNIDAAAPIAGITFTPNNDELLVAVDAAFGPNSVVILVRDTANAQRFARRTLTVI